MKPKEKEYIQRQLGQFLREFRYTNNLSAEQAAEKLGIEIATYRILEGKKTTSRVISVMEYLEKIASLNKMSITSFVAYLERSSRTRSGSNTMKRTLYLWEKDLLKQFDKLGIPLRNRFMKKFIEIPAEEMKENITFMHRVNSLSEPKRKALYALMKEFMNDHP